MDLHIRRALETDAAQVAEIYNWYVLNTIITFETAPVSVEEMRERIHEKLVRYDWLVGEANHQIVGYAYYGSFRPRAAYGHTVESTVYLSRKNTGKGFGKRLYSALIESAMKKEFREVIGVIALPNPASIALHQALGFHEAGVLRGVGHKFGKYVDVGLWQRSSMPV
jgi:L-amino acid N-acyltransferase YncA